MDRIVIGTRGSALAMWQAHRVESLLRAVHPGLDVAIEVISTKGDVILDVALSKIGDKGLFTKELENAILDGRVHVAVHSLKDMPTTLPEGLIIAAVTERHAPEDALVAPPGTTIDTLSHGATVATGSLRRQAQLLARRPDLNVVDVRGNVQTRLEKYQSEGWDGMILARAGLERMGLEDRIAQIIPTDVMLPATGQGALCIEASGADTATLELFAPIEDASTRTTTTAERAMLRRLEGGCQVPIAAHATLDGNQLHLRGLVASLDGRQVVEGDLRGPDRDPETLGTTLAERLLEMGAGRVLERMRDEGRAEGGGRRAEGKDEV